MVLLAIIVVLIICLFAFAVKGSLNRNVMQPFYGWKYAHRGLHGDGIPENSLAAFAAAKSAGYGVELDVRLLKDGNLAVLHDSRLMRMTGNDGVVENLTAEDLKNCYLNGTNQTIPLLSQVLELYDGAAPLIVELKSAGDNINLLCENTCRLLDNYNGLYCLESFDPRCVRWLRNNRPHLVRGQLSEDYFDSAAAPVSCLLKFLLTHQLLNFMTVPDFIAYRYKDRKTISNFIARRIWKMPGVSWTLQSKEEYDIALTEGWIPIFEGFRP